MKTKYSILILCFLLLTWLHNEKLYAQGIATSFDTAENLGLYSESFQWGRHTRNTTLDKHYPILIHDELNYVLGKEDADEPVREFIGAGNAMYFRIEFDTPFRLNVKTENMPALMNGVYMHVALKRKNKYYVIYSCLGKGEHSVEDIFEYYPELFNNGRLNVDVTVDVHPDEYYIILAGMRARAGGINYGYMHVSFSGSPIPANELESADYLPSLDPNVLPSPPPAFENIAALDNPEVEEPAGLNLTTNKLYVYNRTYTSADAAEYREDIQYYDGLGRLKQVVRRDAAPTFRDIVSTYDYDSQDRILCEWIPVKVGGNNEGKYVSNYKDHATSYYRDSAYINREYENLYIDRGVKTYAPGSTYKEWRVKMEQKYLFNKGTTGALACRLFKLTNPDNLLISQSGYYSDNELYVNQSINEDKQTIYSFTDKTGKLLLTRQITSGKEHDTYYVYDRFDNLAAVLPPLVIDKIGSKIISLDENNSIFKNYAYLYKYDSYNRCVAKKLPGCEWVYYIYDMADQLIFTQDGEQRGRGEWFYSIPDVLGRVAITGVCSHTFDHTNNPLDDAVVMAERAPEGTGTHLGYNITGTAFETKEIGVVNYYDDYDFLMSQDTDFSSRLGYDEKEGYGRRHIDPAMETKTPVGLLVGSRIKNLGNTGSLPQETVLAFYYDERARLIQTRSTNHLGGTDSEYVEYDYIGQPLKTLHIHTAIGQPDQMGEYLYTYDHAGRLLTNTYWQNNGETILLAENTYDEVGRLKTTNKGDSEKLRSVFNYNVRSWVTAINNSLFTEGLKYTFTGNIYSMDWQQSQQKHCYIFEYDGLSRLLKANYSIPATKSRAYSSAYSSAYGGSSATTTFVQEDMERDYSTRYRYDKHGNISSLVRYGKLPESPGSYGVTDELSMSYTGNQLTGIAEVMPMVPGVELSDDLAVPFTQYTYNKNGALIKDSRKGIQEIQYNSLHLPQQIDIKNSVAEARNEYLYSATGVKLRVTHRWNPDFDPDGGTAGSVNENALSEERVTDYVGNYIYENGALKRVLLPGGYYDAAEAKYYFYLTDHLGNTRVVADQTGEVVEESHYYPYGLEFAAGEEKEEVQPYKYNGKELDSKHGLNLYDYSARYYDPFFGRFTTMDPLAEKYYSISPYAYVANNPMRFVDPTGMLIDTSQMNSEDEEIYLSIINEMRKNSILFDSLYSALEDADEVFSVQYGLTSKDQQGRYVDGNLAIDKNGGGTITFYEGQKNIKWAVASEEFFHAFQHYNRNNYDKGDFNREFEAKVGATAIGIETGGIIDFQGMGKFQDRIKLGEFEEGIMVISPKIVNSLGFINEYKKAANEYSNYNIKNNLGNIHYRQPTNVAPYSLQQLINKAYGK